MSIEAINWAFQQPIRPSTAKFVLVALANCADGQEFIAWPSARYLSDVTGQDIKTVLAGLKRLRDDDHICDTGERRGFNKQVVVYRLNTPKNGSVIDTQKRNTPKNGTHPKTEIETPVFPEGDTRFSHERHPKTGDGNNKETVIEPSGTKNKPGALELPDWLPAESWAMWDRFRKQKSGKGWTDDAKKLSIVKLEKLMAAGNDPAAVIEQSVERGWAGLFEIRVSQPVAAQKASRADRHANWNDRLNQVVDASLRPERPREIDMGTIQCKS